MAMRRGVDIPQPAPVARSPLADSQSLPSEP